MRTGNSDGDRNNTLRARSLFCLDFIQECLRGQGSTAPHSVKVVLIKLYFIIPDHWLERYLSVYSFRPGRGVEAPARADDGERRD